MTPNGCGRFCAACQKTVIDFTVMTDAEILDIFRNSKTNICGRFFAEQLNRPLQEPGTIKPFPFYRKIATAVIAIQTFAVASFAQAKKKPAITVHDKKPVQRSPVRAIKGRLMDGDNTPAAGVPLTLAAAGYDTLFATTDERGCFLFGLPDTYRPDTARIATAASYATSDAGIVDETITLNTNTLHTELKIYRFRPQVLPEAQAVTSPHVQIFGGGTVPIYTYTCRKTTVWQKIARPVKKHKR